MALISTSELADLIGDPKLRILDARWYLDPTRLGIDAYRAGHIPGAFFADLEDDFTGPGGRRGGPLGRHPFPSAEQAQRVIRLFGITSGVKVVAYDDASGAIASRVWFVLRAFGFDECAVLDGGITKWIAEGREVTDRPPSVSTMTDFVVTPRQDLVASKAEVRSGRDRLLVLDARLPERYRGEAEPIDPQAGHIPGAISAPYTQNLTADPCPVFKPAGELRAHYEALGAGIDREPVVYCGSGVNATHSLLALHLAGLKGRLYAGSWSEWCSDPSSPVATGETP